MIKFNTKTNLIAVFLQFGQGSPDCAKATTTFPKFQQKYKISDMKEGKVFSCTDSLFPDINIEKLRQERIFFKTTFPSFHIGFLYPSNWGRVIIILKIKIGMKGPNLFLVYGGRGNCVKRDAVDKPSLIYFILKKKIGRKEIFPSTIINLPKIASILGVECRSHIKEEVF